MKSSAVVCAIALSIGFSGLAVAVPNPAIILPDRDNGRNNGHDNGRHEGPRGGDRGGDRGRQVVEQGRGAGPDHNWRRGGRLPSEYRGRQYVVNDWRGHHLSAPPRGYQWVQAGPDYVLAAIATGVIASILLNQ